MGNETMSEIDRIVAKYLDKHYRLEGPMTVAQCLDAALLEYGQIVREEKWIPVSERKPEENAWVIVCFDGDRLPIGNLTRWWDGERFHDCHQFPVSHWMPIPARPGMNDANKG